MKFYEGHKEEDLRHDVVLHLDGEPRTAQIPRAKTPFKTLTQFVEEALAGACPRCDFPWSFNPLTLADAQTRPCSCEDNCSQWCAGLASAELVATASGWSPVDRYCASCFGPLSDQDSAVHELCPECRATNAWGR